ncbi:hypothetical protein GCM10023328_32840 [Modestobacter marinus]|uniref:Secreted protein n=1 Tax=Modestobacter marinus TaxID=477641 RepID=A0A846LWS8_9ACTN|nr:hypothetical protein [Modestobacter marinus]NIH67889.1 hypothetical protein [Modestobacter marinus]GGL70482.1 hypothetical protein GCM10011589_28500 [Modestobacter marinus]
MRNPPALRPAAGLLLAVSLLTACAERGGAGAAPPGPSSATPTGSADVALPAGEDTLVVQVADVGGFTTPEMLAGRLPIVSVYADGRVITQGPVPEMYPGPAWPNVQVQEVDEATVQQLAERALDAGIAETTDLGSPPLADATSTRFTLHTADRTVQREVYALRETAGVGGLPGEPGAGGLTEQQEEARAQLQDLLDELTDLSQTLYGEGQPPESYRPEAVAALAGPWTEPGDDLTHPEVPWPGPALPGEPVAPGVTCVTATGDQAQDVADAARDATTLTPWVGADGARWSITFRPLLPHESGCADLTD